MRMLLLSMLAGSLLAPVAPAESLAQVAQRERERRAKLKSAGQRSAPVVDEEALKGNQGRVANDPGTASQKPASSPGAGSAAAGEPRPAAGVPWPEAESEARPQSEAAWRAVMAEARQNLERMTKQYDLLAGAHLATGEYFVDPRTGENVIGGAARLQQLVAEAKHELELAQQKLATLQERARREHVPPGWLR